MLSENGFEAGDKSVFAFQLTFQEDADASLPGESDLSVTWGGFQLWAGGRNLCAHSEEGEIVDTVHWYLLPLMEWLMLNWDALLHEERLPNSARGDNAWASLEAGDFPPPAMARNDAQAARWEENWSKWRCRHCFRAAREGGIFPDVVMRRWRDEVEISWGASYLSGMPEQYRFQYGDGLIRIEPEIAANTLFEVLLHATEYLTSLYPESGRFSELSADVRHLNSKKRDDRLMWLAGLGVDSESVKAGWKRVRSGIASFGEAACEVLCQPENDELVVTGSCHAALMFGTASPDVRDSDISMIARQLAELSDPSGDPDKLRPHIRRVGFEPMGRPWQQGYDLAETFIDRLGIEHSDELRVDVDRLIGDLCVTVRDELHLSDVGIRGISIAGPRHRPGIILNMEHDANKYPSGRRFTLAHELCHILYDREIGRPLALASGPWAPLDVERRANAFAAMLLMPSQRVDLAIRRLTAPLNSLAAAKELARQFGTSIDATLHHLFNLGYLDESGMERVTREAEFPSDEFLI